MKSKKEMEQKILEVVQAGDYRPVKPKLIARKLKLDEAGERELKRSLKELVKRGEIAWGPKHLVLKGARKPKQNEIRGVFRKAAAGFGFVTPLDSKSADRSDDIYIPRHKTEDAADGDTVRIRVSRRRQGPELRIRGRILEVIERRTHRFVGTYTEKRRRGLVMVDNGVFDGRMCLCSHYILDALLWLVPQPTQ